MLPNELLLSIFDHLDYRPATKRLLGATCHQLYELYKADHYEEGISIHVKEITSVPRSLWYCTPLLLSGSEEFLDIITSWLAPPNVGKEKGPYKDYSNRKEWLNAMIKQGTTLKVNTYPGGPGAQMSRKHYGCRRYGDGKALLVFRSGWGEQYWLKSEDGGTKISS